MYTLHWKPEYTISLVVLAVEANAVYVHACTHRDAVGDQADHPQQTRGWKQLWFLQARASPSMLQRGLS